MWDRHPACHCLFDHCLFDHCLPVIACIDLRMQSSKTLGKEIFDWFARATVVSISGTSCIAIRQAGSLYNSNDRLEAYPTGASRHAIRQSKEPQ
jgi:hypothetical protein